MSEHDYSQVHFERYKVSFKIVGIDFWARSVKVEVSRVSQFGTEVEEPEVRTLVIGNRIEVTGLFRLTTIA